MDSKSASFARTLVSSGIILSSITVATKISAHAAETASCASVRFSKETKFCKDLNITFDISGCGDKAAQDAPELQCFEKSGKATLRSEHFTYEVSLKETSDGWDGGSWSASSRVKRTPLQQPEAAPTVSVPVAAEPQKAQPFSVKGAFRMRTETNSRTDFASYRSNVLLRVRPDFVFNPNSEVTVLFQPQAAKTYGEKGYYGSSATANTATNTSGATYDPFLSVHQTYLDWHPDPAYRLVAGRQILSYGNELVIGALEWNNIGRAFDAVKMQLNTSLGATELFAAKIVDGNITATSSGDKDLYGLYNSWSLSPSVKSFDLYLLAQLDSSGTAPNHLFAFGVRAQSKTADFDYRIEATKETGTAVALGEGAHQLDAEVGYTWDVAGQPRFAVEALTAGKNYNQLYPTAHKWLGYADLFGRQNITSFVAHWSAKPLSLLTTQVDFHTFSRTDASQPAYKLDGSSTYASPSDSKSLGTEIDLTVKYELASGLAFTTGYAVLSPEEYLTTAYPDQTPKAFYLTLESRF